MNLFRPPRSPAPQPLPSIDTARQTINAQRRRSVMRGRAASMLTSGTAMAAPTAQRAVTGN